MTGDRNLNDGSVCGLLYFAKPVYNMVAAIDCVSLSGWMFMCVFLGWVFLRICLCVYLWVGLCVCLAFFVVVGVSVCWGRGAFCLRASSVCLCRRVFGFGLQVQYFARALFWSLFLSLGLVRASSALHAPRYFCIYTPRSDPFLERNSAPGSENR